jgi:arylsulfatase A
MKGDELKMKPNIILILADDMGYGDFGIFSDGSPKTPALDQLVKDGVCLTQHYSASPVCAPARAGLLTGRYPHRTGAIDTLEARGLDRLSLKEITMADIFKSAGYVTGLVGKWHLGAIDPRYHPNARGFDEFVGFRGGWSDYYQWYLDYNGKIVKSDGRYLTDVFTQEAIEFLRRHRREPFFLHLAYNAPHFPFQAPEEDLKPFIEKGKFTKAVSLIYAMIYRMDKGISAILEELRALGLEENTILIFTSDNGPQFGGEGEMCTTRYNANFRGCKTNVYEGGIRVPAVIRWQAGGLVGGKINSNFVHFTDWLPTLCSIAGIDIPKDLSLDGQDVSTILLEEKDSYPIKRFWQWNRYAPIITINSAMRDGKWKLVRPPIPNIAWITKEDGEMDRRIKYHPEEFKDIYRGPFPKIDLSSPLPPQLFDIEDDPYEEKDLAHQYPQIVEKMLSELEEWFRDVEEDRRASSL